MSIKSFSEGVDQLNSLVPNLIGGISWAMITHEPRTAEPWKLHVRNSQPCYGEMRKYRSSHGDLCTQPTDTRPGDLHHPFPLGTPMAIGVHWGVASETAKEIARAIFHPIHSPWKKGFKKPEIIMHGNCMAGISFYDTSFDPTVFVHALKFFRQVGIYNIGDYQVYRNVGLDPYQAMLAANVCSNYHPSVAFYPFYTNGQFTPKFSVRRFKNKDPKDLSGGTFRQRFDYNRKHLNFIFDDEDGVNLQKQIMILVGGGNKIIPANVMADAVKEVLR